MTKNAKIILKHMENDFFIPNQYEPNNISFRDRMIAIQELINLGLVQKRNCEGVAYEKI